MDTENILLRNQEGNLIIVKFGFTSDNRKGEVEVVELQQEKQSCIRGKRQ